jgi:hypothetical protein
MIPVLAVTAAAILSPLYKFAVPLVEISENSEHRGKERQLKQK